MSCAGAFQKFSLSSNDLDRQRTDEGWALISVLWIVAMLAMMAGAVDFMLVNFAKSEQRLLEQAQMNAVLNAAINRAILAIADDRADKRWHTDGRKNTFSFAQLRVDVTVQDQLGLIDLNAADESMIVRLIQSQGSTRDEAETLADRILDWRNPTGLKSLHGGDDADYASAGLGYHPRHGPFQSVSELQLVRGITPHMYKVLAPELTVYSGRPTFDTAVAPAAVLKALYLDSPDQVDAVLQARSGDELQSNGPPASGRSYEIAASALVHGRIFRRSAVIIMTGDPQRPYLTLTWN